MSKTWFVGDLHLGHFNIINFTDNPGGKRIRPFDSIEEHDQRLIDEHNKLVDPKDRVYFFGDLAMKRKDIAKIGQMNGRKKLIKGNHDIYDLKDYTPYFEDILAYRIYPDLGIICSHIPVHTSQLEHRFTHNIHGHLHINLVTKVVMYDTGIGQMPETVPDDRYINICPEHTDWKPVDLEDIKKRIGWVSGQYRKGDRNDNKEAT